MGYLLIHKLQHNTLDERQATQGILLVIHLFQLCLGQAGTGHACSGPGEWQIIILPDLKLKVLIFFQLNNTCTLPPNCGWVEQVFSSGKRGGVLLVHIWNLVNFTNFSLSSLPNFLSGTNFGAINWWERVLLISCKLYTCTYVHSQPTVHCTVPVS